MSSLPTVGRKQSHQAFSIVEILIVLAIFSAMVGVFVTGFGSLQKGFSRTLALHEEVQRAIRLARREAGKSQMGVFIWYPADHSHIGITRDDGKALKVVDDEGKEKRRFRRILLLNDGSRYEHELCFGSRKSSRSMTIPADVTNIPRKDTLYVLQSGK
jgi:type II secretory pathway pseudopilin PulG